MVDRIWRFLHRDFSGLHEAASLLALSSLVSQILALVRDRLLAAHFGAGNELDLYYAAFRLPDLIYVSAGSFVSVTVLVPFIFRALNGQSSDSKLALAKFLDSVYTVFFALMTLVVALGFIATPALVKLITPGFSGAALQKLIFLNRLLLLSPFLLGLSNLLGSITQAFKRFFIYALSPIIYNLGIIFGLIFLVPRFGLSGLVLGVVLGALGHLVIQLPTVWSLGFLPHFTRRIDWPEILAVIKLSLPRTLTLATHQLSLLVIVALASFLHEGSIAVFNFAYNLQSVPLAVVGLSYSVAAFPSLVAAFTSGERGKFVRQLGEAARHIIFWSLPISVLFIVLRAQIVRVILGSGHFDWADTRLTAAVLALLVVSLVAQSLVLLFVRAYYAAGRTAKPLIINSASSLLVIILSLIFSRWLTAGSRAGHFLASLLRVDNLPGVGLLSLPLAFSLGLLFNLGLFWWWFQRDFGQFGALWRRSLEQSILGSLGAGAAAYLGLQWLAPLVDQNTFLGIFLQGLGAGIGGSLIGWLLLRGFRNQELIDLTHGLKRQFWRSRVLPDSPEEL